MRDVALTGNIERQPPQETEGGIFMSIELNRRDFLKLISTTATAAAISGKIALWPLEAVTRSIADPTSMSIKINNSWNKIQLTLNRL